MAVIKRPTTDLPTEERALLKISRDRAVENIFLHAKKLDIRTAPLDVESLAASFGIRVIREEMDIDMSGYIEQRQRGVVIGVNKYQSARRQRFTIAHELGHFLYDKEIVAAQRHDDRIMLRSNERDPRETRANEFAAEILMPKEAFAELINRGIRTLEDLADRFDVSLAAVRYRAYKLHYLREY